MNIAYIVPSLANKGPVIVVRDLVRVMIEHGHHCTVFYFDEIKEVSMECICKKISFRRKDFSEFDIVHSHGIRPDMFVFLYKPFRCKTKFISTLHNYVYRDFKYQYNRLVSCVFGTLWMLILRRHDKIVALSRDAKGYYEKLLKGKDVDFVYNTRMLDSDSLNREEINLIERFKGKGKLLGINALLTKRKGVDMVINALPYLHEYKLFVVGDGRERMNLERLAERLGVENRIMFAGYIKDAYRFIPFYDIYIMPSRSEGFPLSMLEVVQYKTPIVLSSIPIFRELFDESEVSFFKIENIESLVNSIKNVTHEMAKNAYIKFQERYSMSQFFNKYLTIYED